MTFAIKCLQIKKPNLCITLSKTRRIIENTTDMFYHLLYDIEAMWRKTIKHAFYVLYSEKAWFFDQSERAGSYFYYKMECMEGFRLTVFSLKQTDSGKNVKIS